MTGMYRWMLVAAAVPSLLRAAEPLYRAGDAGLPRERQHTLGRGGVALRLPPHSK